VAYPIDNQGDGKANEQKATVGMKNAKSESA
jgi:hypothetical protein